MKHTFKTIGISLTIILGLLLNPGTAASQTTESGLAKDITKVASNPQCFDAWSTFVSETINYDEFGEYWKDLFVRYNKNLCHYMDISNLQKQIDLLRTQIKEAYLSCNEDQGFKLQLKFYELDAELYYLRNFIDIPHSDVQKISDDKMLEQFTYRYLLDKQYYFDEEEVKKLFDRLKKKYESRVKSKYEKCEDPSVDALTKKWKSFKESIKSMGDTGGKSIKANWGKAISTPPKGMANFIKGVEAFRLNSLPAPKTNADIFAKFKKEKVKATGLEPTVLETQDRVVQEAIKYDATVTSTSIKAEYEAIYKQGGDSLTKDYAAKIEEINTVVEETLPHLVKLKETTKTVEQRQCQ